MNTALTNREAGAPEGYRRTDSVKDLGDGAEVAIRHVQAVPGRLKVIAKGGIPVTPFPGVGEKLESGEDWKAGCWPLSEPLKGPHESEWILGRISIKAPKSQEELSLFPDAKGGIHPKRRRQERQRHFVAENGTEFPLPPINGMLKSYSILVKEKQ